jgi:eukaryotic-like serine/threonine-protein kinase
MAEQTRHHELSDIFNQALELEPIEREKFLDEACRDNPELRHRVESLLKSFEKSEDFIEKPIVEIAQILPTDETLPLENARQLAETNWQNRPHLPSNGIAPKLLRGDLDNIVLMALRKEPTRRYASVTDLSADISNYLNGLPVTARPNTFFYLAEKFYIRNKTASIVGLFLALSLIFGIIATSWQSVVASRQRDRAEKRFEDVRQLSNSLLFEITPQIENLNGSTKAREILVKRALGYLDSLANESTDDLQLQSELASAYEKVGELQANGQKPSLNDLGGAIESYRKAQNIRQNLPETLENKKGLAQNFRQYSEVIYAANDVKGSLQASNDALGIYEKLTAENPQDINLRIAYVETKMDTGATFSTNNQYDEAIPIFRQTLADLAQLDQNNQEILRLTSVILAQLGNALSWNEKQPEAETEMAKAVKIAEDLTAKYPNDNGIRRNTFRIYVRHLRGNKK